MHIAIIIPTKNEEKTLAYLIESIREQTFKDLEIIVADANSKDRTREIAKNLGCEVVDGGNPSVGRNKGAKKCLDKNIEVLVFMDADIILPSVYFLNQSLNEFTKRNLDVAGTLQFPLDTETDIDLKNVINSCKKSKDWRYNSLYNVTNFFLKIVQNTKKPHMQQCMFVKKSVYEKLGGFDETLEFAEDSAYAKKAVSKGFKFGILNEPMEVFVSPRRFDNKGFWKMLLIYFYFNMGDLFNHEFKINKKISYHEK